MERPTSISDYLRAFALELGQRILDSFPPLQGAQEPPWPLLSKLLRRPLPGTICRDPWHREAACRSSFGSGSGGVWHRQDFDFAGQLFCRFGREAICLARDGPEPSMRSG
jgi:hypothetical protein